MQSTKRPYQFHATNIPYDEFRAIELEIGMKRTCDHAKTREELIFQKSIAQTAMQLCEVNPDKTQETVWNYYREIIEAIDYRFIEEEI